MSNKTTFYTPELIDLAINGNHAAIMELYTRNEALTGQAYKLYKIHTVDYYRSCLWELLACKLHLFKRLMLEKDRKLSTWVLGSMRKRAFTDLVAEKNLIHIPSNKKITFEFTEFATSGLTYELEIE